MESLLQSGYRAVSSSPQYCFILPICSQNFPTSLTLVNHRSILSSYSFDLGMSYKCNHAAATAAKSLQSCPTLRDPMDCSLPDSSAHGISQARVLEWVAIAFSGSHDISCHNSENWPQGKGNNLTLEMKMSHT